MRSSAYEFERAISRLREYSHTNSVKRYSPAEFLTRLQQNLEWLSSYERLQRLARAMVKFLSLLRLEGD